MNRLALSALLLFGAFVAACGGAGSGGERDASRDDAHEDARDDARSDAHHDGSRKDASTEVDASTDGPKDSTIIEADAGDGDAWDAPAETWPPMDAPESTPFDAGIVTDAPPDVYPAPHPAMPSVVNLGGLTLTTPNFVPVFYSTDPMQGVLASALAQIGPSASWQAATSEYGIAPATSSPALVSSTPPPSIVDNNTVPTLLENNLGGPTSPWGSPSPNSLYVVFMPPSAMNETCGCGGYHNWTTNALGELIAFAVVFEQYSVEADGGLSLDTVMDTTTHELVEAVTDTEVKAYAEVDAEDQAWTLMLPGGICPGCSEVGDMCELYPSSLYVPPDLPFSIQRTWSNASAAASHDPCVPIPSGEVYFNSAVVPTDNVVLETPSGTYVTHGVQIGVGHSRTIDVQLYSDAPTPGPWTLAASNCGTYGASLGFSFDTSSGVNGDTVHLTITVPKSTTTWFETFCVSSTLGSMTTTWYGLVSSR
jgi:hypothetical protein